MKKVREKDLKLLIAQYYCIFLDSEHKPINDIINGCGEIHIDISSVYIEIFNVSSKAFDKRKNGIRKFSKQLEAVTLGNLKVTYSDCSCISIANSYEVIDIN